jgi:hypothetical protein
MRRLVGGLALVALVAGCGSGSTEGKSAPTSTASPTPTIIQPSTQSGSLTGAKQRLEAAGYSPRAGSASGDIVEALDVDGVSLYAYRTSAAAHAQYVALRTFFDRNPGKGLVRIVGSHLYDLASPHELTSSQRTRFTKVVKIAEEGE